MNDDGPAPFTATRTLKAITLHAAEGEEVLTHNAFGEVRGLVAIKVVLILWLVQPSWNLCPRFLLAWIRVERSVIVAVAFVAVVARLMGFPHC